MAEGSSVVGEAPEKTKVLSDKLNTDKKCKQCLCCRKEIETLRQELDSANEVIKLLKEDVELVQRFANASARQQDISVGPPKMNNNTRNNEWQTVRGNGKRRNNRRNDMGKPQQVTTTENMFAVLSNVNNNHELQKQLEGINKQQLARNMEKNKIILMGHSHIKGYALELRNRLGRKFEVMGTVLPGARLQNITHMCSQEINSLRKTR